MGSQKSINSESYSLHVHNAWKVERLAERAGLNGYANYQLSAMPIVHLSCERVQFKSVGNQSLWCNTTKNFMQDILCLISILF